MSKKPSRSRHRIPPTRTIQADPVDARYQREVDRDTARAEQRYRAALDAVERARAKAERLAAKPKAHASPKITEAAWRAYEQALHELREIEALMQPGNHASAKNRGRGSFGPAFD